MRSKLKRIKTYLRQPTTLSGLVLLASVVGWQISPEQLMAILNVALPLVGMIMTFLPEAGTAPETDDAE